MGSTEQIPQVFDSGKDFMLIHPPKMVKGRQLLALPTTVSGSRNFEHVEATIPGWVHSDARKMTNLPKGFCHSRIPHGIEDRYIQIHSKAEFSASF